MAAKKKKAATGSGIRVQDVMEWLWAAMDHMEFGSSLPRPTHPRQPKGRFAGGSENMKALLAAMWILWSVLTRDAKMAHDEGLVEVYLQNQRRCHDGKEPWTPSHAQLHAAAKAAMLLAALRGKAGAPILDGILQVWRFDFGGWDMCRDASGIWMPGARAHNQDEELIGSNGARDLCDLIIREKPFDIPGRTGVDKKYYAGPRALSLLPKEILQEIRRPLETLPPMIEPFHVARWADAHVAWFSADPFLKPKDEAVAVAYSRGGARGLQQAYNPEAVEALLQEVGGGEVPSRSLEIEGISPSSKEA